MREDQMLPILVPPDFPRAAAILFPNAHKLRDWRVEDHVDGVGSQLVYWGLDAPIPTPEQVLEAMARIPDLEAK
jgi:hypothetical protein